MNEVYMINGVEALYPRLNRTYRFDKAENRSVPCETHEENARYELSFKMSSEQAKAVMLDMARQYSVEKEDSWPEKFPLPFAKEDNLFVGKTSLKGAYGTEATRPPLQFDSNNDKLAEDFLLTTGSTVNIAVNLVPYMMKVGKAVDSGVSLRLRAVQVIKYVPLESKSPFGVVEGFTQEAVGDASPFSNTTGVAAAVVDSVEVQTDTEDAPIEEPKKVVKLKTATPSAEPDDLGSIVNEWFDD